MLAGHSLQKRFGDVVALEGVDIEVRPGHITVLVGPSGSGKTTLVRCLAFLEQPDAGTIQFNGDIFHYPRPQNQFKAPPWPELTVVFQQHFLWPHLTIRQNVMLPLERHGGCDKKEFKELVYLFEMEEFLDRHPNEVSIGQRQRAAMLRALLLHPKIILMDEITAALDVEQIGKVSSLLLALRARGIGMLVISHLLGFARSLLQSEGDRVVFLYRGKVLESGGDELFDSARHPRVQEFIGQWDPSARAVRRQHCEPINRVRA